MSMHLYRGFEIYPLIYPHSRAQESAGRYNGYNDQGFDAAVKICLREADTALTFSDTFKLSETPPFPSTGAARRASLRYAEDLIDRHDGRNWMQS
ncbi:hypothetical protein [Burkholderia glumae]|uniref:Uncharacterized protein n=1 Tax=Burkholderia glumae TaxID=337 RepID=A0AAP9Y064_BURGL|nr:hypothetical protein [Burkholderia glumae]ACR31867.1 Hypothetical protein bglu_2g15110 [Burkholderia glumae BGR1]AJY64197.1 hypothetical protein KS03_4426 [Burkholderia glumae LMG 2196 = ATCC 33617]KHJ62212.1 hypothetical protein NCPPB3923_14770 [Burkholderia glumae]MCM2484953.1 hypothetical protein [Burkholderia glumae]MCM2495307.1 hypothetical protein [Burkholderia glumae]